MSIAVYVTCHLRTGRAKVPVCLVLFEANVRCASPSHAGVVQRRVCYKVQKEPAHEAGDFFGQLGKALS